MCSASFRSLRRATRTSFISVFRRPGWGPPPTPHQQRLPAAPGAQRRRWGRWRPHCCGRRSVVTSRLAPRSAGAVCASSAGKPFCAPGKRAGRVGGVVSCQAMPAPHAARRSTQARAAACTPEGCEAREAPSPVKAAKQADVHRVLGSRGGRPWREASRRGLQQQQRARHSHTSVGRGRCEAARCEGAQQACDAPCHAALGRAAHAGHDPAAEHAYLRRGQKLQRLIGGDKALGGPGAQHALQAADLRPAAGTAGAASQHACCFGERSGPRRPC